MNTSTFTEKENTLIYNGLRGWTGETKVKVKGYNYVITTMKRHSGFVVSDVKKVQDEGDGSYSFMVFGNKDNKDLLKEKHSRVTEKVIKDLHFKALSLFLDSEELPSQKEAYQIELGQVIFTHGYNTESSSRRAIYEIKGNSFKTVRLDGTSLDFDSHIRSYADKFGIGVYYNEGDKISIDELNDLVISASLHQKKLSEDKEAKKLKLAEERKEKISIGSKILDKLPNDCQAVIIAEHQQNESDSMTDYFGSKTTNKVFLAFSSNKRNSFSEMSKAALNFKETEHLANNPELENRENYSGGHGYYLGKSRYSGWQVRKIWISANTLEEIQISIAEEKCFIPFSTVSTRPVEFDHTTKLFEVVQYSEKAVAIFGDTRTIKEQLKSIGARFNPSLNREGKKVAGWILPAAKRNLLNEFI